MAPRVLNAATFRIIKEMSFRLGIDYKPRGDQATAIASLLDGLKQGEQHQVLLGVTGSGKTFTMAKVIEHTGRPALILAHNKTLAAQLYQEFKTFFPSNAVEYFVSYYDYYQPKPTFRRATCISKKRRPSIRSWTRCASPRRDRCSSGAIA